MESRTTPQALKQDWQKTANPDGSTVIETAVDRVNGRVFTASGSGRIASRSMADGSENWVSTTGQLETFPRGYMEFNSVTNELALSLEDGGVTILDAATGDVVDTLSSPLALGHNSSDGTWYGSTEPSTNTLQFKAFDPATRDVIWVSGSFSQTAAITPPVGASVNGAVVSGVLFSDVAAVNLDGTSKWRASLPLKDQRLDLCVATGERVVVGNRDDPGSEQVAILNASNGGLFSAVSLGASLADIAAFHVGGASYASVENGVIQAIDANGVKLWNEDTGLPIDSHDVAVTNDNVAPVVGDKNGQITKFTTDHTAPPGAGDGGDGGGGDKPAGVGSLVVVLAGVGVGSGGTLIEQEANLEQRFGG